MDGLKLCFSPLKKILKFLDRIFLALFLMIPCVLLFYVRAGTSVQIVLLKISQVFFAIKILNLLKCLLECLDEPCCQHEIPS